MAGWESLHYAFGYVIDPRLWPDIQYAKLLARKIFFDTAGLGPYPDGIHLVARWRNPDNKNPLHANWKTTDDIGQSLPDFYSTLHGARGALAMAEEQTRKDWMDYNHARASALQGKVKPKRARTKVSRVAKRRKRK